MSLVSVTKILRLMLASVAEQASLSLTWSETPEDTFSNGVAHMFSQHCSNDTEVARIQQVVNPHVGTILSEETLNDSLYFIISCYDPHRPITGFSNK